MLNSFLSLKRDSDQDNGHSSGLDQREKWYSISEDSPQGEWDKIAEKMMVTLCEKRTPNLPCHGSIVSRSAESKGGGKLSIHYCADIATIETVFRIIISVNCKEKENELKSYHKKKDWFSLEFELCAQLVSICAKDFHQEDGHSLVLDQKRSGILLMITDHKENGTESRNWWWSSSDKADTQFSEPGVHCLEERSKAKVVENYQYTSALLGERL